MDPWSASIVATWTSLIGQKKTHLKYGRSVLWPSVGLQLSRLIQNHGDVVADDKQVFLSQMYHNNVLEFYIVTTDENECNWMMFVRKAR